jgi:hypothetical protein
LRVADPRKVVIVRGAAPPLGRQRRGAICANVTIRILRGEPREMRGLLRTDDRGAQDRGSCDRIRIGVVRSNKGVMTFWTSQGSEATGELRRWHEGRVESEVVYLGERFS